MSMLLPYHFALLVFVVRAGFSAGETNQTIVTVIPAAPSITCESITMDIPTCINVGWNNTSFPNLLSHETQAEAYDELEDFNPLIEVECSNKIVHFLCAVYAPVCLDLGDSPEDIIIVAPCRSLCEYVRSTCEPQLVAVGYPWPAHLNCDMFSNGTDCLNVPDSVEVPVVPGLEKPTTSTPNHVATGTSTATPSTTCEPITVDIPTCINVGWNSTSFPNLQSHETQAEAYDELEDFNPLIEVECSNKIVHFLCAVYAPLCLDGESPEDVVTVVPCRSLCEYVRNDCEPQLEAVGCTWPAHLNCDNFPVGTSCLDVPDDVDVPIVPGLEKPTNQITTNVSTAAPLTTCDPITIDIPTCLNVGWSNASFPNLLSHQTQADAYEEMKDFDLLIELQCSNKIVHFLCAVYAPLCFYDGHEEDFIVLEPCWSLCEYVRKDCEPQLEANGCTWPARFNCDNFVSEVNCLDVPDDVEVPPPIDEPFPTSGMVATDTAVTTSTKITTDGTITTEELGSCAALGFSGCCSSGPCLGGDGSCYCDQACYSSGTCCPDIQEINCFPAETLGSATIVGVALGGFVVGAAFMVAILVIVICCCLRNRKKTSSNEKSTNQSLAAGAGMYETPVSILPGSNATENPTAYAIPISVCYVKQTNVVQTNGSKTETGSHPQAYGQNFTSAHGIVEPQVYETALNTNSQNQPKDVPQMYEEPKASVVKYQQSQEAQEASQNGKPPTYTALYPGTLAETHAYTQLNYTPSPGSHNTPTEYSKSVQTVLDRDQSAGQQTAGREPVYTELENGGQQTQPTNQGTTEKEYNGLERKTADINERVHFELEHNGSDMTVQRPT